MGIGNVEKYLEIGKIKKQESGKNKENKEWAKGFNKEAKKMYGEKMAEMKDKEREAKREATAAKWNGRKEKIQETGRNISARIGKTVENASLLRRALPEIGKDALTGLKQGAENKIGQLMERGSEAFNKCSGKIENARSGAREWVDGLRDAWKMRQTKKMIEKCASIAQQIRENHSELKSPKNQERIKRRMERLKGLLDLSATIREGGNSTGVRKPIEQGFAMGV